MALTPATIRTDLKCGAGSISPGEKCHKGQATKAAAAKAGSNWREKAENTAINVGGKIGGAALIGSLAAGMTGHQGLSNALGHLSTAGNTAANAGRVSRGLRTGNNVEAAKGAAGLIATGGAMAIQHGMRQAQLQGIKKRRGEISTEAKLFRAGDRKNLRASISNLKGSSLPSRARARKSAKNITNKVNSMLGRRDSVWATGFSPELDQLSV